MANMLFANNCNTTLNGGITAVATSMVVTSATGFPSPTGSQYFYCTLADAATQTTIEIVKVTAVSGTTFTIVRGQDGTSGTIFASGAVVSLRLVRASLNDFPKLDETNTFTADQAITGQLTTSAGLATTSTFTATPPTDGLVMDYATGWGRFSAFGGDGFQWYNAGVATTKLMELSSTGVLTTTGQNLTGLTASSAVATDSSKNLVSVINTGTGNNVLATSPVLTTPNLGTPSAINLTNATALPYSALPTGSVLQVVNATYATQVSSSTASFVDTGLTATITPKFSNSKILIIINQNGCLKTYTNTANALDIKIVGGNTGSPLFSGALAETDSAINNAVTASFTYLDSPATTSATTYKTQFQSRNNQPAVYVQYANVSISSITLMEIAG